MLQHILETEVKAPSHATVASQPEPKTDAELIAEAVAAGKVRWISPSASSGWDDLRWAEKQRRVWASKQRMRAWRKWE